MKKYVNMLKMKILLLCSAIITAINTYAGCQDYMKSNPEKKYQLYAELYKKLEMGATLKDLDRDIPNLSENMASALKISKQDWTDSEIWDELAKAEILSKPMLQKLGIPFVESAGILHVPAGLMHSYGYLFSQLKTQFGLKGKRWIESRIDERLGLAKGFFSPFTEKGEFLKNLTGALRKVVAGKNETAPLEATLIERVKWISTEGVEHTEDIMTHFVKLKTIPGHETTDTHLLIYEVKSADSKKSKFVTAFPINEGFYKKIISDNSITVENFKPRYNYYVDRGLKAKNYEKIIKNP